MRQIPTHTDGLVPNFNLTLTDDFAITGFRDVRVPLDLGPDPRIIIAPVEGDSLLPLHICHGDYLVCEVATDYEDGTLGLWQTPDGRTAKFACFDFDDTVTLHNENGWQQSWPASDVKLLALVIKVERDLPVTGRRVA